MRKRIMLAAALLVVVGLVVAGRYFRKLAVVGAGYAAEQTCACMFVSGRTLDSCRGDLEPMARRIVGIEPSDGAVRTHTLLSSATARFEAGFGCTLVE
ncbi:MAG TPA: hypothetical protein VIA18_01310 [Polyangia bacterium]|jgi:hypothetical protein|nr:hypothetical protein [Polyangia bacterium]